MSYCTPSSLRRNRCRSCSIRASRKTWLVTQHFPLFTVNQVTQGWYSIFRSLYFICLTRLSRYPGMFWGYTTRIAKGLTEIWTECPYDGGYDLSIGTSENGDNIHSSSLKIPKFKYMPTHISSTCWKEDQLQNHRQFCCRLMLKF